MCLINFKKYRRKIAMISALALVFGVVQNYASGKHDPEFPDTPIDQYSSKNSVSEGVIYSNQRGVKSKSPVNPTPSYVDEKEKKLYDTYVIDVNTIAKRIEYFSPTYVYAVDVARNSITAMLGVNGVSSITVDGFSQTVDDYKDNKKDANTALNTVNENIKKLESISHRTEEQQTILNNLKETQTTLNITISQINLGISGYKSAMQTMNRTMGMLQRTVQIAGIEYIKDTLAKSLTEAFLSYKQLEYYETLVQEQVNMYKRIYDVYKNNVALNVSTELDLSNAKYNMDNAIDTYNTLKSTKDNVKDQICVNLGYSLSDEDKLIFVEPTLDLQKILSINIQDDYEHAYNSSKNYQSIEQTVLAQKNRSDSTRRAIYDKYVDETKQNIINNLDSLYANLQAAYKVYEGSLILKEAYDIDVLSAKSKKAQGLVSEAEGLGLDLQNISTAMIIATAKYDLIKAYYAYYYGTYGIGVG